MESPPIRVGVIGAGGWSQKAHLPSYQKCSSAEVIALCDVNKELAENVARQFGIPKIYSDYHELLDNEDLDAIDVCSSANSHFEVASEVIKKEKSVLCEKPLAISYEQARSLWLNAKSSAVKTKMGFTYRYSPALRRMKELIQEGFLGEPYIFNGFEQNSQFVDPLTPFRWNPSKDKDRIMPGSLEEYAPHLIDIALWLMGDINNVTGRMKNFVSDRFIRDAGKSMPINIEDATIWLADFENGAIGTFQSSFVVIGGYPGMEVRLYGSKGAIIARLVEEFGVLETLSTATPEMPEFRQQVIPERLYPNETDRNKNWVELYFGRLIQTFISELIEGLEPEANFADGAKAQQVEDAVYLSHLRGESVKIEKSL